MATDPIFIAQLNAVTEAINKMNEDARKTSELPALAVLDPNALMRVEFGGTSHKIFASQITINTANFETILNKQDDLSYDGTATKYPTVDAVNDLSNQIARFASKTGLLSKLDTFDLIAFNDTTARIAAVSSCMFWNELFVAGTAPESAIKSFAQKDYPLNQLLTATGGNVNINPMTTDGKHVRYIGYDKNGNVFSSANSFMTNNDIFQIGFLTVLKVGSVISFLDGAAGVRNVFAQPTLASNTDFDKVGATITNIAIAGNAGASISTTNGSVTGLSVNWKTPVNPSNSNPIDVFPYTGQATAQFISIDPTFLNGTAALSLHSLWTELEGGIAINQSFWNTTTAALGTMAAGTASVKRIMIGIRGGVYVQNGEHPNVNCYPDLATAKNNIFAHKFSDAILPLGVAYEIARVAFVRGATAFNNDTQFYIVNTAGSGGGAPTAIPPVADATTTTKGILKLAGDLAGTADLPTITNAAVIAKVLTGYVSGAGTVAATDSILQAIQKLNGNDGLKVDKTTTISTTAPLQGGGDLSANRTLSMPVASGSANGYLSSTDWTTFNSKLGSISGIAAGGELSGTYPNPTLVNASVIGKVLTGYVSGAGTVAATDTILQAIQKINGNDALRADKTITIATTAPLTGGGDLSANRTIAMPAATGSVNGYLTSTDWTTFNNKTSNLGTVTNVAALTLGTTGTDANSSVANPTTTPVITLNLPSASAANRGLLTAADWTTFNNKTSNLGTVTSVAALTLGTAGTDVSSTVANGTTTPVITLNIPTSSAANRGLLSAADWTTFNSKAPASGSANYIQNQNAAAQTANFWVTGAGFFGQGVQFRKDGGGYIQSTKADASAFDILNFYASQYIFNTGSIGVGTTPAITPNNININFPQGSNIQARTGLPQLTFSSNVDGDWYNATYKTNGYAAQISIDPANMGGGGNGINFNIAPSGTAGAAITWQRVITINAAANTGFGTTAPTAKIHSLTTADLSYSNQNTYSAWFSNGSVSKGLLLGFDNAINAGIISSYAGGWVNTLINPNGGNFGVGVNPTEKLHSYGNGLFQGAGSTFVKVKTTSGVASFQLEDTTGGTMILRADGGNSYITSGNFGFGTAVPVGKVTIALGNVATTDIVNQPDSSFSFSNLGAGAIPTITGKSSTNRGIYLLSATVEANAMPDMELNVRKNDGNDYSTYTSVAFRLSRHSTTLIDVLRNGNTTFVGNVTAPTINGVKRYVVKVTQSGTAAPVVTNTYRNDLAATPTYARANVGSYSLTSTDFATPSKVKIKLNAGGNTPVFLTASTGSAGSNRVDFITLNSSGALADGLFSVAELTIDIEVFP